MQLTERSYKSERQADPCQSVHQWLRQFRRQVGILEHTPGADRLMPLARRALAEIICRLEYGRSDMFLTVGLETTAVCNRSCSFCTLPTKLFAESRKTRSMSDAIYEKIIYDLSNISRRNGKQGFCGTLHLNGFGEPLLDRQIFCRLELAHHLLPDATLGFYSNGDRLTEEVYLKLKSAGVNEILITPHDGEHRQELIELANKYALDGIIVLLPPLTNFSNRAGELSIEEGHLQAPGRFCIHPSYTLEITADGQVAYCAQDSLVKHPVGNVADSSIMDVWDNPAYVNIRKALRQGKMDEQSETCRACRGQI